MKRETMMKTYFNFVSQTRILLATFGLTWLFILVIFPPLVGDLAVLDLRPEGYDFAEVMAALGSYGEAGRMRYAWISPTLDTLFPLCFTSFYAGAIWRFAPHEKLRILAYVALLAGVFDLGENAQITTMLLQYPDISVAQVDWANRFTLVKFALSRISMLLAFSAMILAAAMAAYKRVSKSD
jgi:hypothetical protein